MSTSISAACGSGQAVAQTQAAQYRSTGASGQAERPQGPPPARPGFVSAIASALQELGGASESSDSSTGTDAASALGSFLDSLMEELHGQQTGALDGDLSALREDLSADAAGQESSLHASFGSLLDALGIDSGDAGAKLGQFLDSLAGKLQASGPSGSLINTTA